MHDGEEAPPTFRLRVQALLTLIPSINHCFAPLNCGAVGIMPESGYLCENGEMQCEEKDKEYGNVACEFL